MNDNLVHQWRRGRGFKPNEAAAPGPVSEPQPEFVALSVPAPQPRHLVRRTHPLQRFAWSSNTEHPHLTQQARALVPVGAQDDVMPWERPRVPDEVNGSRGAFRVPKATCTLDANNAYEAVQAWLALHKSSAT